MTETFTRLAELDSVRQDQQERNIYRFRISTPGMKGDGLDIPLDSWDLSRFTKHPNVLLNHNIMELPIGRAENVWTTEDGLWADVRFSGTNPKALEVRGLIDEGIMSSTSVNFRPHNVDRQTGQPERTELVELSIVSVPEDADVMMARSMWGAFAPVETVNMATPRLSVQTIWDTIKEADIADLEWHMKDSLGDVRALAGRVSGLGLSDDLQREVQDTIVALRVLFDTQEESIELDADEVITIDLSKYPALTGAKAS